jgi:hypothetical protein
MIGAPASRSTSVARNSSDVRIDPMDVFEGDEERRPFGGFEKQRADCVERARLDRFRAESVRGAADVDPA